jgi:hypothetical protein
MFDWIRRENRFDYMGEAFPYHDPDNGHFYRLRADADKVCDPEKERLFGSMKYEHLLVRSKKHFKKIFFEALAHQEQKIYF